MVILEIEHPVPNFAVWKSAFDNDPVGRQRSGVRRYRILRPIDNPNFAIIQLEFDNLGQAEAMVLSLRQLWARVEGTVMSNPQTRIVELVESKDV